MYHRKKEADENKGIGSKIKEKERATRYKIKWRKSEENEVNKIKSLKLLAGRFNAQYEMHGNMKGLFKVFGLVISIFIEWQVNFFFFQSHLGVFRFWNLGRTESLLKNYKCFFFFFFSDLVIKAISTRDEILFK